MEVLSGSFRPSQCLIGADLWLVWFFRREEVTQFGHNTSVHCHVREQIQLWFVVLPNRDSLVFEKVNGPFFRSSDIHNQHPLCTYSIYWGCDVMLKSSNMWVRNSKVGLLNGSRFQHSNMILYTLDWATPISLGWVFDSGYRMWAGLAILYPRSTCLWKA